MLEVLGAPSAEHDPNNELFLPAHNSVTRAGARARVANPLCFGNSKTLFAQHVHDSLPGGAPEPVAVHGTGLFSNVRKLAASSAAQEEAARSPLYLVDDLPAELDKNHCASVGSQLASGRQVVLTAVDRGSLEAAWGGEPLQMFHVEQGHVTACGA